jgi:putative hydrolase of the HAD superfamily
LKGIKHIFFDLDHTLWDYDRSAKETLIEIYNRFEISKTGTSEKKFINTFYSINDQLWHKYNIGEIDREYIKKQRFELIFEAVSMEVTSSGEASNYFMAHCSTKPYLMPDTLTALHYLESKYELHIITNGFLDAQDRKLSNSGLNQFFKVVVTSECASSRKPAPEIFEYSLQKAGAMKENSVMIGDNPKTDIHGAREYGIRTVFYDPSGKRRSLADFNIQSHMELLKLF